MTANASGRLVWLWLLTGLALRRGDLEQADRFLPELQESSLASEEPHRILPMASVAIPRALLDGDTETVQRLADVVLAQTTHTNTSMTGLPISRALAAAGESERLAQLAAMLSSDPVPAVVQTAKGLVALLDDRADEAAERLLAAEHGLRSLGRHYDAACIALDVARALEVAGDSAGADAARGRASELLDRLGCVNPW